MSQKMDDGLKEHLDSGDGESCGLSVARTKEMQKMVKKKSLLLQFYTY